MTVGQQRLNVFRAAAAIWGNVIDSNQTIRVLAFFDPLQCTANSGALGMAAPYASFRDFGAGKPATWYPVALAEKLAGADFGPMLNPADRYEVIAVFNSALGTPGCLQTVRWYYGVDRNVPSGHLDLLSTVVHEIGHGLGFTQGPTNRITGVRPQGFPSVWEHFLLDLTQKKTWLLMDDTERQASSVNTGNLVWSGGATLAAVPQVLSLRPELQVFYPSSLPTPPEQLNVAEPAAFGGPLTPTGVTGYLQPAIDTGGVLVTDACETLTAESAASMKGHVALIDRGNCSFTLKATNVQMAGAIGAVIVNNTPDGLMPVAGVDPFVTIPVVGVTQALGNSLREQLRFRGRGVSPVRVNIRRNPKIRSGTTDGYPQMYAPPVISPGSSVAHWDVSMDPNQLMEPFYTPDMSWALVPPMDLTKSLLTDLGW
jgi:hypothetical protein